MRDFFAVLKLAHLKSSSERKYSFFQLIKKKNPLKFAIVDGLKYSKDQSESVTQKQTWDKFAAA